MRSHPTTRGMLDCWSVGSGDFKKFPGLSSKSSVKHAEGPKPRELSNDFGPRQSKNTHTRPTRLGRPCSSHHHFLIQGVDSKQTAFKCSFFFNARFLRHASPLGSPPRWRSCQTVACSLLLVGRQVPQLVLLVAVHPPHSCP